MFGLIMGMSAMFMVGACIGIGMTALCSASREAENMEENLNMKNVQDIFNQETHRYSSNSNKRK